MSRICDMCDQACTSNNYLSLTAWWGKHLDRVVTRRKKRSRMMEDVEVWEPKALSDEEGLKADICRQCAEQKLAKSISFHPKITRMNLYEDYQREHPNTSAFECLRKTIPMGIKSITCDICHTDCFSKHLLVSSNWQNLDNKTVEAHICEFCVNNHLSPQIKFQISPNCELVTH